MIIPAVFFGAIGVAIGWYAWRGIVTGKILVGIRGSRAGWNSPVETWFVRREDPVSFWIAISLVALVSLGTLVVALGPLFQNRPLLFSN
jgi:hypothetical protein